MWLHCPAGINGNVSDKDIVWMAAYVLPNLCAPFSISGAVTDVHLTHDAIGTNTPPSQHRCWLLNFALVTIWMLLFLFSLKDSASTGMTESGCTKKRITDTC